MDTELAYRIAFLILLGMLLAMRVYFMVKVRRSGGKLMPKEQAVEREGGRGYFFFRVLIFFALIALLVMYFIGAEWLEAFSFTLLGWLRWAGFALGAISIVFWTWTQVMLDTQWSAQLQLTEDHHLVTSGPYAYMRHPLYTAMFGWSLGLSLLTANWVFVALSVFSVAGLIRRVPQEEQMMIEAFGDEYTAYMEHTGRFLSRLRK